MRFGQTGAINQREGGLVRNPKMQGLVGIQESSRGCPQAGTESGNNNA